MKILWSGLVNNVQRQLLNQFVQDGIIQFGLFSDYSPIKLNLEMLPAFPNTLNDIAERLLNVSDILSFDQILVAKDTLPLGVLLSNKSNIPLVYSDFIGETPNNFIGAFDVGHPTALVVNLLTETTPIDVIINSSKRVGLNITKVITILSIKKPSASIETMALIDFDEAIDELLHMDVITKGQATAIHNYLYEI